MFIFELIWIRIWIFKLLIHIFIYVSVKKQIRKVSNVMMINISKYVWICEFYLKEINISKY